MYLHTVKFNKQNEVTYNFKWEQKRKRKKKSTGKDKKSKRQKTLTTAKWKQMRYYSWGAVTGLCVTQLQLNTRSCW